MGVAPVAVPCPPVIVEFSAVATAGAPSSPTPDPNAAILAQLATLTTMVQNLQASNVALQQSVIDIQASASLCVNHWCEDVFGPDEEIVTGTRYITHLPRPQSIPRFWLYVPTPGGDVSVELRHNGSLVWSGVVSGEKEVAASAYQAAFQSGNFAVGRLDLVVTAVDTAGAYSTEPMGLRICV